MAFVANKHGDKQAPGIRDAGAQLTEKRREKLLSMKKREDMKDVLVKKFKEKFGKDNAELINSEVGEFVETAAITDANLKRLEKRLEKRTSKSGSFVASQEKDEIVSNYSATQSAIARNNAGGAPADWKILDEYAVYLHELDAINQKSRKKESQAQMHAELDAQVAEAKARKGDGKKETEEYVKIQLQEIEIWRKNEQEKIDVRKEKNLHERAVQDEQLLHRKRVKKEEEMKREAEEKLQVKKIEKELREEQERLERKKAAEKAAMAKVFEENQINKAKKEADKAAQVLKDIETIKEYNKIMEAQEKARKAELEARQDRQKVLMDRMKQTVTAQADAKGAEDEERARKQGEEKNVRAMEMEINKREKLKQMAMDNRNYLLQQMRDKDQKKQMALELKKLQAGVLDDDTKAFAEQEKKKKEDSRKRNVAFRVGLQNQIKDQSERLKNVEMSETEGKMNRDLLEMVYKTLQDRDAQSSPAKSQH